MPFFMRLKTFQLCCNWYTSMKRVVFEEIPKSEIQLRNLKRWFLHKNFARFSTSTKKFLWKLINFRFHFILFTQLILLKSKRLKVRKEFYHHSLPNYLIKTDLLRLLRFTGFLFFGFSRVFQKRKSFISRKFKDKF